MNRALTMPHEYQLTMRKRVFTFSDIHERILISEVLFQKQDGDEIENMDMLNFVIWYYKAHKHKIALANEDV